MNPKNIGTYVSIEGSSIDPRRTLHHCHQYKKPKKKSSRVAIIAETKAKEVIEHIFKIDL